MLNPRLASRYAKSLIDLSLERGQLEQVFADMKWLNDVCKSNRDFVNVLRSPVIKPDVKKKVIAAVTDGRINELTNGFIRLLITKNREINLPEILTAFIASYKKHKNIQIIKLTSAAPLSDSVKEAIVTQVRKSAGFQQIELEEKVDPALIGGFVLQVGDRLVDASVLYDLKNIAKQFENNDFIYKIR
jgi:F-type H+-transporting ATPase subunit delta